MSTTTMATLASLCVGVALIATAAGHGFMSQPRARGALWTQRPVGNIVGSEAEVGYNGWAYCPHCQNGGGVNRLRNIGNNLIGGFYQPFKPMEGKFRDGVSLNGDEDGNNDHSANGRYRAPPSKPYSAEYQAGGVANFEYDITTPHGGYLQFFLCDVSSTGGDLERSTFQSGNCYLLERAYNAPCESGNDPECGPIDPKFPSRWYLPCRVSDSLDQNQILGGSNGKMSYKIPNVAIKQGVIMSYWLTSNNCSPTGLQSYFASGKWSYVSNTQCAGDGGSIGGYRRDHIGTCETQSGKFPEEFWNTGDVKINGGGGGGGSNVSVAPAAPQQNVNLQGSQQPEQQQQESFAAAPAPAPAPEQQQQSDSGVDQYKAGCLPQMENRNDEGYLNYWKQLEDYCRK